MVEPDFLIGDYVRQVRTERGLSLRAFAQKIGKTPTFVSRFERNDDVMPSEETLRVMAGVLGIDADDLIFRADKVPADLPQIVQRQPAAMAALLRTAQNLSADELNRLTAEIQRMKGKDSAGE